MPTPRPKAGSMKPPQPYVVRVVGGRGIKVLEADDARAVHNLLTRCHPDRWVETCDRDGCVIQRSEPSAVMADETQETLL